MFKSVGKQNSNKSKVAVVGCGIFGAMAALRLAESGAEVHVFERGKSALMGASYNNQNRLHLGFHYPRDDETARQCMKGFQRFRDEFAECILQDFRNAYFIAKNDSMTSSNDYLSFCDRVGLRYNLIDLDNFSPAVHEVAMGITTEEVVYDCSILRSLIQERMDILRINPFYCAEVNRIERDGSRYKLEANGKSHGPFDAVVNCTYANINLLNVQLGYMAPIYQYEYTMVPIIEWDQQPVGLTVMDGRFMTVLPYGKTGKFLLYHVDHTVIATETGTQMPAEWLDSEKSPSQRVNSYDLFNKIIASCTQFVPSLQGARLTGFLQGPRMVLANRDSTDARPSIINYHELGYVSVFTGKIDHCMWVAEEIAQNLSRKIY